MRTRVREHVYTIAPQCRPNDLLVPWAAVFAHILQAVEMTVSRRGSTCCYAPSASMLVRVPKQVQMTGLGGQETDTSIPGARAAA